MHKWNRINHCESFPYKLGSILKRKYFIKHSNDNEFGEILDNTTKHRVSPKTGITISVGR